MESFQFTDGRVDTLIDIVHRLTEVTKEMNNNLIKLQKQVDLQQEQLKLLQGANL